MTAGNTVMLVVVGLPILLLLIYMAIRVGAAAFFKSKQQFDNQGKGQAHHGT